MVSVMILLYQIGLTVVLILASPLLLFSKKARFGVSQKLGFIPQSAKASLATLKANNTRPLWIHAVSVGEFNAVLPLLKKLRAQIPDLPLFVTTTTGTGQAMAKEKAGAFATVAYFPYDLPGSVNAWLDAVQPAAFMLVETEIWPGFVHECHKRKIPVMSVNARMSPKSFRSYFKLRFFFKEVLTKFTFIGVQSKSEAERFASVQGSNKNIEILGNIKLDGLTSDTTSGGTLSEYLKGNVNDFFFTAGSTHEGEEAIVLDALKHLIANKSDQGPVPKLVIAPRHPERFEHVRNLIKEAGFKPKSFSKQEKLEPGDHVFLLDTLGKLMESYSISQLAFVGGTLVNIGGHNVAEPFAFSVPVVCGPFIQKTRDLATALSEIDALTIAPNVDAFKTQVKYLYDHKDEAVRKGNLGKNWIDKNLGACDKALAAIQRVLANES
ncbi:MAG: 3-deoxy-D-manno-octulosonic acid transferase [Cyanobacteria bacterium TGS_CYA1]|nr:3-deoxy-D-manno-octulosonic acid transferase [Cyanobacteria bacterium TGS_CYA1]